MGDLYSSALGTTVIRHRALPARPANLDGMVAVLVEAGGALDGAGGEAELKRTLGLQDDERATFEEGRWLVRFASHARAEAAVAEAGSPSTFFTLHNGQPYDQRGWTTFESAVSTEALARVAHFKGLKAVLAKMPPKLVDIDGNEPREAKEAAVSGPTDEGVGRRIERVRGSIRAATFTVKGDANVVLGMYADFITRISNTLNVSGEAVDGVYEGERNMAGQAEGRGILRYAHGNVYEGEFRANKTEGRGTLRFADGTMYAGEWKANRMEGRGTYRYADGEVYEGEWKAGQAEGHGTLRYADGDVYEGQYKADKKEGRGTYRYADGVVYEGEWKADKREGRGTYKYADGNVYEGEYKADKKEGRGTYRYADGAVYEGEWKGGKEDGRGTYWYADGNMEVGFYKQGFDAGEGVKWSADGLQAWRLMAGKVMEAISPEEARQTAQRNNLPIPGAVAGGSPAVGAALQQV